MQRRPKRTYEGVVSKLKSLIGSKRVTSNQEVPRLLFLCGANKTDGSLSARRQALCTFIARNHPDVNVIIAEKVYTDLLSVVGRETRNNLLDFEAHLTWVADYVLIILEGQGAFCELGAFSHTELRSKVVVINDSAFESAESFINYGPIAAIRASSGNRSIIHYPMHEDGKEFSDRIADTFKPVSQLLSARSSSGAKVLSSEELCPHGVPTKNKLFFLHDLIHFCGDPDSATLIRVIKSLFGDKDYRLQKELLAVAISIGILAVKDRGGHKRFVTTSSRPLLRYGDNRHGIEVGMRLHLMRSRLREL